MPVFLMVNKDIITHLQLTGFVMSEDLAIEIAAKLIDAINNIAKEDGIIKTWLPPATVVIASVLASIITYRGMVRQTNETLARSDFLFLSRKKEELYAYLDMIKREVVNEYNLLRDYSEETAIQTRKIIRRKLDKENTHQKTINKINMIISIYLQELHGIRVEFNTRYYDFISNCKMNHYEIINAEPQYISLKLMNLKGMRDYFLEIVDIMQKRTINIVR